MTAPLVTPSREVLVCAALVLLGVGIGWSLAMHLWWHVAVGIAIGALVWSEASRRLRNARAEHPDYREEWKP